MTRCLASRIAVVAVACLTVLTAGSASGRAQDEQRKHVTITATEGGYEPSQLDVRQDQILAITFVAKDRPHSLNIDAYRIAKRAEPGTPANFEFRAERAGSFPYYCNLSAGGRTHEMRGELLVRK